MVERGVGAAHFSEAGLKFLRGLGRNNERDWFEARRGVWEREWRDPMLALIGEVNGAIEGFAPEHVKPAPKTIMRIYRDIRFAKDKRPYKTHVAAWWGREGMAKTSGAGFYFDVSATEMTVAAGVFVPEREQMLAIRRMLVTDHAELRRLLAGKKLRGMLPEFDGQPLTRPPKGFAGETEAMDLLLCRRWGVAVTLPASRALEPDVVKQVVDRFRAAAPLVAMLNRPFATRTKRPLF